MRFDLTYRQELTTEALIEQRGCCKYCKEPLAREEATADHKWPVCRRGRTSRENIVAACRRCNQVKGEKSEGQFYKLIDKKFPRGAPLPIIEIWATRRIWRRAHRACDHIGLVAR